MPPGVILMLCPLGQLRSDIVRDAKASVAAERINASSRQIGHRYFLSVGGIGDAIGLSAKTLPGKRRLGLRVPVLALLLRERIVRFAAEEGVRRR